MEAECLKMSDPHILFALPDEDIRCWFIVLAAAAVRATPSLKGF